ncbi:bifunctional hydroxymethylpyrimidine kinase/phosphomethylpyrimidine kinase [Aquibacillus salsiterrae]|uniref:Hydroxymethylpyrimidine/phosphomethylpyrimidine kinase n=1 Tax=Aquibacillus salsiterrae TaxID=2950439 RepID=A0A9X3WFI1_9BACI|nr:bifunctional hydroxymethylpyrimidine kinase/phosphomethylpyrimidine kinase [Aquibacillus salsiterrae]MDC3418063.1 bifunctional hydroxymethylpyrimidine kinase/phosphomethylpyrimidine kinase [Aquibacillus salsiterrae]
MEIAKALTIAGSDSGGGAGIQADLKTFQELDVFGMSAITAITAQNTVGVQAVYPLTVNAVTEQIKSVAEDLNPNAVKTGMLFSSEIIDAIANEIKRYRWSRVVVDPVMIAKGGSSLLLEEAVASLKDELIPLAFCVTPNIPEAEKLVGFTISTLEERKQACEALYQLGAKNVVIKGGHSNEKEVTDLLFDGETFHLFSSPRTNTNHTHGTGCTFGAAITAELAKGKSIYEAVKKAKDFIGAAIEDSLGLGAGHGPTNHMAYRKRKVQVNDY